MDADHPHPLRYHVVEGAPVGLAAVARELRDVWINPAMAALGGLAQDAFVGRRPSEIYGEQARATEELLREVLATGGERRHLVVGTLPSDGEVVHHWDVTYFALDGESVGIAAVEVTEQREAEAKLAAAHRRDALMARAGQLLSTALSVRETAELVAHLAVPEIADWCFVELVNESGGIDRVSYLHRDESKTHWLAEYDRRYPLDPDAPVGSPKVIRTGEPELIEELPEEFLVAAAQDEEHLRILREVGFVSVCIVPLIARGRVLGDIALATDADSGRRYGPETLALAQELADRCALALDNARLYAERDLVAMSLQ